MEKVSHKFHSKMAFSTREAMISIYSFMEIKGLSLSHFIF